MQIEEGKFYKNRAGEKVGPMRSVSSYEDRFRWRDEVCFSYPDDGCFFDGPHLSDLIEEWGEPQALPPATEADEGWGPWYEGVGPRVPIATLDYREERINGVWRWQSRPRKPVVTSETRYINSGDIKAHWSEGPWYGCTHKITFTLIDEVPDCSSVKMEPL
jgi:hypothetical protein